MRISDWSSDVCSSDLRACSTGSVEDEVCTLTHINARVGRDLHVEAVGERSGVGRRRRAGQRSHRNRDRGGIVAPHVAEAAVGFRLADKRSEEHTSELQSLMRISYAVFCLKKKKTHEN